MNSGNTQFDQSNTPVAAFLRNNAPTQGMGVDMSGQFGNSNIMMNSQPQVNQLNNFNLAELKRLQQLQQQLQATNQAPNPMMQSSANPSALLFQNYLDQKIQSTRFNDSLNPLAGVGGFSGMGSQNPLINSNLFQEQLMINQNVMNGMKSPSGEMALPSPHSIFHRDGSRRMRGGVIEPFPEKLHRLLLEVEAAGRSDIISFVANGRAFAIHMPDKFFKDIVPLYFRQSRLSSFKRQLNLYGFELINTGPARGGYFHELFVKDRPDFCRKMRRVAVKVGAKSSKLSPTKESQGEDAIEKADKILKQLDDEQSSRNDKQDSMEKPLIESGSLHAEPAAVDISPATGAVE
ncbi:unnamed protein product [Cylindrotheca closterium]|uniref:HSF-type DNA-binding domain-containing protein n=1 Tax=Cylindrotheca closterium TaxID=2856 RepID=A0AAD2JP17_9STRA|nr:unnamed protein product [Cylindrotheca closterium]